MNLARKLAEDIISVYDDYSQLQAITEYGLSEWEEDRIWEMVEKHDVDFEDISVEVIDLCVRRLRHR